MSRASMVTFVLACSTFVSGSCVTAPLSPDVERRVRSAIAADLDAFPEIRAVGVDADDFALSTLDERDVFFQSNFTNLDVLAEGGPRATSFSMQVNERAFTSTTAPLDDDALRAVIAHELGHTLDYVRRRSLSAWLALAPVAAFPESFTWEKWTDLVAVDRGFGPGLLRYRRWQRRVLDDESFAAKKRIYYGPLELALLVDVKARCPKLFATFLENPPKTAREIATRCP